MRTFGLHLALPCLLAISVAACNAPAPTDAAAAHIASLHDDGRGEGYEFHIRYPELAAEWTTLDRALRDYAAQRKQQLIESAKADKHGAAPAVLDLEFTVARRTEAFASVLAQGGVHAGDRAEPIAASFVLHTADNRLVAVGDLFTDPPAALKALSDESKRQLEGRYEASDAKDNDAATADKLREGIARGTAPDAANFAVFLVDGIDTKAIGLTLIFPQAQVAMPGFGEQQVEVPAKLFYTLLKPEYVDAFSVDDKELERGKH